MNNNPSSKIISIVYLISNGLLALFILLGIFFINSPMAQERTKHLGLPNWFRLELGVGSFIGGLLILLPFIGKRLKEWAYVGLGIVYLSALIAHLAVDGIIPMSFTPLVTFAFLLTSYLTYHKLKGTDMKEPI
jgi:hypothetical protein